MSYYPNVYASQTGPLVLSGLDANFNFAVDIQSQSLYAAAGGAADIITATYTPAVTALVSGLTLYLRAATANVTTTPTFSPNSLTAKTIVKANNQALVAGDIAGAGHILILQYDATNGVWELANPATANTSFPSGTANGVLYLNGSKVATSGTALVFDGTNLGLGVTPSAWYTGGKFFQLTGDVGFTGTTNNSIRWNNYSNSTASADIYTATGRAALFSYDVANGLFRWNLAASGTAGNPITFTQAMTLDASGNLLVGQTTHGYVNSNSVEISPANGGYIIGNHVSGSTSGQAYSLYAYNGIGIGSITQNGTTGVLYNLTSDYRLKNNQEDLTDAKDFIMALKPKKWQWWDGSGEGVGFIAHEFMEVAKHSGHGEKDAVETIEIKDDDGNITGTEERPIYQSIQPSSSEVMAYLVAHIQNLEARLAALEAK